MSLLLLTLALSLPASAGKAAHPAEVAGDAVLADLAAGRAPAAIRRLQRKLAETQDPVQAAALRCVLGPALRRAGDLRGAIAVLAQVPQDADCGPRAAFDRADAHFALGELDLAAALYAEVGGDRLGPGRDAAVADRLGLLIAKLRAAEAPDGDQPPDARARELALYRLALGLTLPPERRLNLALEAGLRELDSRARPGHPGAGLGDAVAAVLQERLLAEDLDPAVEADARLVAARLVGGARGLELLARIPAGVDPGELARARAECALAIDLQAGLDALEVAAALRPADRSLQRQLAERLQAAGQSGRARGPLAVLAAGDDEAAAWALLTLGRLERSLADDPVLGADAAVLHLKELVRRFPASPLRPQAESALLDAALAAPRAALAAGDPADAQRRYDAFLAEHPSAAQRSRVAWEAAEATRQAGDSAGAGQRFEALAARGEAVADSVASLFALRAAADGGEAALAWLQGLGRGAGPQAEAARNELVLRQLPSLSLEAGTPPGPQAARVSHAGDTRRESTVKLHLRNIDQLTLRLHRIDPEALLRSGGTAWDLPDLDVAVIAPDREWTARLDPGQPGVDRVVELPVKLPAPGLYALTAATPTDQAQVVLRSGKGRVIARGVGEDLVVGVLDGDRPDPGARVLVAAGDRVIEVKADRSGVARLKVPEGQARVLALGAGGPSLVDLSWSVADADDALERVVDLDRPAVASGDRLGFRLVGRKAGQPVAGTWTLWLKARGVDGSPISLQADARGAVVGELAVPVIPAGLTGGPIELWARGPGEQSGRSAAQVRLVEAAGPGARRLSVETLPSGEVLSQVTDDRGLPIAHAVVELNRGALTQTRRTDARGRLLLSAPAAPVPTRLRLPGEGWRDAPALDAPPKLELRLSQEQPLPGQPVELVLEGAPGPVVVHRLRRLADSEPIPAPTHPLWGDADAALSGPLSWNGPVPPEPRGAREAVAWTAAGPVKGCLEPMVVEIPDSGRLALTVPGLDAGRYTVVAVPQDPRQQSPAVELDLRGAGPQLGALPERLVAGAAMRLPLSGPALVTVEGAGLSQVALVTHGSAEIAVPWGLTSLTVVATDPDGRASARHRPVNADLDVDVQVETGALGQRARITVRGPDGAPVQAQLAVRAVDARLLEQVRDGGLTPLWMQLPRALDSAGAWGGPLHMRVGAVAISGALLAEQARVAEAERARSAARGDLQEGRLSEIMRKEEPSYGLGGISSRGMGSGGGGYGSGMGSLGTQGRGSGGVGLAPRLGPAHLARALWTVQETDRNGSLEVDLSQLPPGAWRLQVRALTIQSAGLADLPVNSDDRPRLVLPPLAAAGVEERVEARVRVSNPRSEVLEARIEGAGDPIPVRIEPGAVTEVALGRLLPGERRALRLSQAGTLLDAAELVLPLRAPTSADPAGRLVRVRVGPGGGAPLLALLEEDFASPLADRASAARAGRAALALRSALPPADRLRVEARALSALEALRMLPVTAATAQDQAEVVAFLAEVQALAPLPEVTRGEVDAAVASLADLPQDSAGRVAQTWALAVAGRPVDAPALGRLLREADRLDAETRAFLARALVALGRGDEAAKLIEGEGPHAILARRALAGGGPGQLAAGGLPPVGDPSRGAVLAALAGSAPPPVQRGYAVLRVDGVERGRIDLATGGSFSALLAPTARLTVEGAPLALVERGEVAQGAKALRAALRPQGASGRPLSGGAAPKEPGCGTQAAPCSLRVGDGLQLYGAQALPGAHFGSGLVGNQGMVVAHAPGLFSITGLASTGRADLEPAAPLWVEVVEPAPAAPLGGLYPALLDPTLALLLAEEAAAVKDDPRPWLAPWPGFDDWDASLRPRVMALRWSMAEAAPAADRVAAFEALRDADPTASLTLPQVAGVARAYAETGQAKRSVEVWRAGLGAAFLAEAAPLRQIEASVGRLPSLQALQTLPLRYPAVPVVDESEFHLPERLAALIDEGLPAELLEEGITPTDVRLLAAAWDRRFLALHPDSPLAPQAGFHLAQALLRLGASEAAADQARRSADAAPDAPMLDGLRYVEGLALADLGQAAASRRIFTELAEGDRWPLANGARGLAGLRPDARYALARLDEAGGRLERALDGYREVAGSFPEAADARVALERVLLDVPERRMLRPGEATSLEIEVANLDQVHLRAYRLDLRTVFLRDGGLERVLDVQVSGVSPAWTGERRLAAGPYPDRATLVLPLLGPGAWLVEIDGEGARARTLIVRSDLDLDVQDGSAGRRVVLRRGGQPAPNVDLRALVGGGAVAATTDLRGVAVVPGGAPVLAFAGDHVAFTENGVGRGPARPMAPAAAPPRDLFDNLDRRIQQQRMDNEADFEETYQLNQDNAIDANRL